MMAVNFTLMISTLFIAVLSAYTDESILLNVDVSVHTVSQLLDKANTNMQNIIENSFEYTNQHMDIIVSIDTITPISSITNLYEADSLRYHTILNIHFTSESEYMYAISKYQNILSNDLTNFIATFQETIHNELSKTLNTDSLSSQAVTINSFNIIKGSIIMNYISNPKQTQNETTIHSDVLKDNTQTHPNVFVEKNLSLLIVFGAILMSICFCGTMFCFWNAHQKQIQQRKKHKTRTWSVEKIRMENEIESIGTNMETNSNINTNSVIDDSISSIDPFKWNKDQVINWLKQTKLLIKYCPDVNGKELLTKYESFAIETDDNNKLVKEIEKLRLQSDSYYNYINQKSNKSKKKKRKPPKKLRRKASRKKTTEQCETSFSSTVEIMPVIADENYNQTVAEMNINNETQTLKLHTKHTNDSSDNSEGTHSMNDNDYYENTSDTYQLHQ